MNNKRIFLAINFNEQKKIFKYRPDGFPGIQ